MLSIPVPEYGTQYVELLSQYLCKWGLQRLNREAAAGRPPLDVETLASAMVDHAHEVVGQRLTSDTITGKERYSFAEYMVLWSRTAPRAAAWTLQHWDPDYIAARRERGRKSAPVRAPRGKTWHHGILDGLDGLKPSAQHRALKERLEVAPSLATVYRLHAERQVLLDEQAEIKKSRGSSVEINPFDVEAFLDGRIDGFGRPTTRAPLQRERLPLVDDRMRKGGPVLQHPSDGARLASVA